MFITKQHIIDDLLQKNGTLNSKNLQKIQSKYPDITIEKLYLIYHELNSAVLCPVCNTNSKFISFSKGYQITCSIKCANGYSEFSNKRVKTKREKYGNNYEEIVQKSKQTSLVKYGVESTNQIEEIKQKKVDTYIEKYGVDNPRKSKHIIQQIKDTKEIKYGSANYNNRELFQTTMQDRYSVDHGRQIDITNFEEFYSDCVDVCNRFIYNGYFNTEHFCEYFNVSMNSVYTYKERLGISHIPNKTNTIKTQKLIFEFLKEYIPNTILNDRITLNGLEIDVSTERVGIEYHGMNFHSFGKSEYSMFNNQQDESVNKNKHLKKTELCHEKNILLLQIFESEWKLEQYREIWKSLIKSKIGVSDTIIYARKCVIKEISAQETASFQNRTHLQGFAKSSVKLGLYYNDILVSAMTFGKSRYDKEYEWELIRFSSELNTTVVGGGSKLLKYFERKYNPKSLLSYANRRWSNGNFYETVGFEHTHNTKPNYFYFLQDKHLESREKFQKHKLQNKLVIYDKNLTESENMYNNGYRKIYDSGNMVFVKRYS